MYVTCSGSLCWDSRGYQVERLDVNIYARLPMKIRSTSLVITQLKEPILVVAL